MKALVVYYSRTGTTKIVAGAISEILKCDTEEIIDVKNRKGILGYLSAGKDAMRKALTEIQGVTKNPSKYDLVLIGTPIWAWTITPAIRTYLIQNKDHFRSVAFFCTMGSSGDEKSFKQMGEICGKEPVATLSLTTKGVKKADYIGKVEDFCEKLNAK